VTGQHKLEESDMTKDKPKGTSILARRRLRQNSGKYIGNEHREFNGNILKTASKTEVSFGNHRDDLKNNS